MSRFTEKTHENVQEHLQPGEEVHGTFTGQSKLGKNAYYMVTVATDRRIMVFLSGVFSTTKIRKQLAEVPRQTQLGPVTSKLWHKLQLGEERIYVPRRHFDRISAIDAAAGLD